MALLESISGEGQHRVGEGDESSCRVVVVVCVR